MVFYIDAAKSETFAERVHASGGELNPFKWGANAWQSAAFGGLSAGATYGATNYVNTGNFGFNGGSFVERPGLLIIPFTF